MLLLPINEQLKHLLPWQQRVFCMALAQQSILHFHLFCDAIKSSNGQKLEEINQLFWEKMTVKNAKINFSIQQDHFEEIIPNVCDFDFYGVYPAIDHCVVVSCIFNSFLSKSKEEALNASQTSFATIASFIELQSDDELDEEGLQNTPLFQEQLKFQQLLLKKLDNPRSPELIKTIRQWVIDSATSNLGIALSD